MHTVLRIFYCDRCCILKTMQFPRKGVIGGVTTVVFLWLFGFPSWSALVFGTIVFLRMGGVQYMRLVMKFLPKDLWYVYILGLYTVAIFQLTTMIDE